MAALTTSAITQNGDYEFSTVPGEEYLALIAGTFGTASMVLAYTHPAQGTSRTVAGAAWTSASAAADLEPTFIGTAGTMKFTVSGVTTGTSLYISVIPILR